MSTPASTNSSDEIADAMRRNVLEVFNTTDDAARRELVEALYAPDADFYDAEGSVSGHDAIDAKIRTLQLDAPGLTFTVSVEPAVIDARFFGAATNPMSKKPSIGFLGRLSFNRSEFGVTKYVPLVSDQTVLVINAAFELQ